MPSVVLLAGPNGAGKTTAAPALLRRRLRVTEFVNADTIVAGLSAFRPEAVSMAAGRLMLERLHELADARADFAFETTLASRSFSPWISRLVKGGYQFHLVFLWLASADLAVERVAGRVRLGGHHVPEADIRRRYAVGLRNLRTLYKLLAETWRVCDSSSLSGIRFVAGGASGSGDKSRGFRGLEGHWLASNRQVSGGARESDRRSSRERRSTRRCVRPGERPSSGTGTQGCRWLAGVPARSWRSILEECRWIE